MRHVLVILAINLISSITFASLQITKSGVSTSAVDRQSHYFGRVMVNSMSYARYVVTNTGDTALTFNSAYVSGIGYSAWHSCEKGLEPQAQCQFEIRYWPPFTGLHSGMFELYFVEDSSVVIDLLGEGINF